MKKTLFAFLLFLLSGSPLFAAPYNMDSPIESYTWGDGFATVLDSGEDGEELQKVDEDLFLLTREDNSALLFRFWNNQLVAISHVYPSYKMTPEEKSVIHARHLKDFTARWGEPALEQRCLETPSACTEAIWYPADLTQVTLYQSIDAEETHFVGYTYASREMQPKYEKEIRDFGAKFDAHRVLEVFHTNPRHAEKTLRGIRIRLDARIVSLTPLRLEQKGHEIISNLRNSKDINNRRAGQIVVISGVLDGVGKDRLLLSDAVFVPCPEDNPLGINRKGTPPKGFFAVETFSQQVEMGANRLERDFSIREYLSPVRVEGNRAIMDFIGKEFSPGVSLSLNSLYADKSGDTLAFNLHMKEGEEGANGYFILAVVGIIVKATQPDISSDEVWKKMEEAGLDERRKTKIVLNGWTYRADFRDEWNFTFSATAPKR